MLYVKQSQKVCSLDIDALYELIASDENEATIKLSCEEHPIFKAHFPSNPILPGFIHFEIVSKLFNIDITQIKKAKFSDIVKPNETLCYKRDTNKFSVLRNKKQVATFSL